MEHFEIEESKESEEHRPLDPSELKQLPLGSLSRGIKPSVFKRRTQTAVLVFPIVFFAISCFFSGFQIYWTYLFNKEHPYTEISQILYRLQDLNCNTPMITDITVIPSNESCNQTYKTEDIGYWNGTVKGCLNPDSEFKADDWSCPHDKENYVSVRPKTQLFIWKGYRFCTNKILTYLDMRLNFGQHRDGYRVCAAEPEPFYVLRNQDCPINDIQVISADAVVPKGYKQRKFADNKVLIFSNDPTSTRKLVDLNTELSDKPCLNPAVSPNMSSDGTYSPYPLSRKKEIGCGEYGQDTGGTVILDKINPMVLYSQNNLEKIQKDLPSWQLWNENKEIVLFAKFRDGSRPQIECNFCSRGVSLISSAKELTVSGQYLWLYVILTSIVLILQFFLIIYNIVKYVQYGSDYQGLLDKVMLINSIFYGFNLCYFTLHGGFAYWDYRELRAATDKLELIEGLNCFSNEMLNKLFDDLRGKIMENTRDIMQDCFKAEIIAVLCSIGFLFANHINKALIKRDKMLMQANIKKHMQINAARGIYHPQSIEEAFAISQVEVEETKEKEDE